MEESIKYYENNKKRTDLVLRLKEARNKIAPIIDEIILSTLELVDRGDNKIIREQKLTNEQYRNVILAFQILRDTELEMGYKRYTLPNTNVIVQNVSVDNPNMNKKKSYVIDEATVVELLQVYEQLGVLIQRMVAEEPRPRSGQRLSSSKKNIPDKNIRKSKEPFLSDSESTEDNTDTESNPSLSELLNSSSTKKKEESDKKKTVTSKSKSSVITDGSSKSKPTGGEKTSRKGDVTPKPKEPTVESDAEPTIFIRIQCFSDASDHEFTSDGGGEIPCTEPCPSHYHVKLDGEPVTLQMNQGNVEAGTVYCINTGQDNDGNDIRIVIKQCPECKSTVIGSSNKVSGNLGESHESITLHGKGGDETNMSFSSSDEISVDKNVCTCKSEGRVCIDLSSIKCNRDRCICEEDIIELLRKQGIVVGPPKKQPKMDVVVDRDNVDKSTIKIKDGKRTPTPEPEIIKKKDVTPVPIPGDTKKRDVTPEPPPKPKDDVPTKPQSRKEPEPIKPKPKDDVPTKPQNNVKLPIKPIPRKSSFEQLQRHRVCSSLEFDVTKAETRLRDREIAHKNPQIVVELKKLGVDQILRACRPAKCCRRAILNERQRTALPYCVSLRSLPLMGNDVEVIKQSIDMSVKKIKNSLDLTQAYKDKLAFYVGLGRDDFRPDSNIPWVIPVYDMKFMPGPSSDKFFLLKNTLGVPRQVGSVTRLVGKINTEEKKNPDKYFILRRPINNQRPTSEESQIEERPQRLQRRRRRNKCRQQKEDYLPLQQNTQEKETQTYSKILKCSQPQLQQKKEETQTYTKILKCRQTKSLHRRKNIWSNVDHEKWRLVFAKGQKHCVDLQFDKTKVGYFSEPASNVSLHYHELVSSQVTSVCCEGQTYNKLKESGDHSLSSLSKLVDDCIAKLNEVKPVTYVDKCMSALNLEPHVTRCDKNRSKSLVSLKLSPKIRTVSKVFSCKNVVKKRLSKSFICLDYGLSSPELSTDFSVRASSDLLRPSKALTNFNFRKIYMKSQQKVQIDQKERKCVGAPKVSSSIVRKLEYYVDLVNGDLIWSNNLPLAPQSYNTYYNFYKKNESSSREPNPTSNSESPAVEDPMVEQKITPKEAAKGVPTTSEEVDPNSRRRSTLSEIDVEFLQNKQKEPESNQTNPSESRLPKKYSTYPMGPEDDTKDWAPHVVSEISLPRIREVVIQDKVEVVEAEPEPSSCSKKPICVKNKCTNCKAKECPKKKTCRPKDITISIKKTKNKGICVGEMSPKPCNKEICEIYKNKKMIPEKSAKPSKPSKSKDKPACEKYTIKADDNIEIYINNQKVCVSNKCKRAEKSDKSAGPVPVDDKIEKQKSEKNSSAKKNSL